tara:strand:- start:1103 stop:2416 length:1314 start_codon:yes stop_codon:yes gene_type:complete
MAVTDKDKSDGYTDSLMEVEVTGNALENENKKVNGGGKKEKEGGFRTFVKGVGEAFSNIAEGAEKKLETVYDDREKRAMFLSGLNTIIDASSYTPITQAKSAFGTIAGGQKKGFLESEAIQTKRDTIEAKKLSAEAKKSKEANEALIDMLKLNVDKDKAKTAQMKPLYDRLFKKYEFTDKAGSNQNYFDQLKKLTAKEIIDSGQIPVGLIYSKFPKGLQAFADVLPSSLKPDNAFFEKIQDEATYLQQVSKLIDSMVLGDIGQLVPVSDKDVEIKRNTFPTEKNSPLAFVYSLRTQDAINKINAYKGEFLNTFTLDKGLEQGQSFENSFNTKGADLIRADLVNKYNKDELYKEAALLGFQQDYDKYTEGEADFSPLALAEAAASLDLGGYDRYSRITSSDFSGGDTKTQPPVVSKDKMTNEEAINEATKELGGAPDI